MIIQTENKYKGNKVKKLIFGFGLNNLMTFINSFILQM